MMDTICLSETLASTNKSTRQQNAEKHHLRLSYGAGSWVHPALYSMGIGVITFNRSFAELAYYTVEKESSGKSFTIK
jgi:hypothetical protein